MTSKLDLKFQNITHSVAITTRDNSINAAKDSYAKTAGQVMATQQRQRGQGGRGTGGPGGQLREVSLAGDMTLVVWSVCDRRVHIVAAVWSGCALSLSSQCVFYFKFNKLGHHHHKPLKKQTEIFLCINYLREVDLAL